MSSTNQTQTSKDKGIIQGIGFKEFTAICDEYQIVETATKELLSIASNPDTNERVKVDIYKWVIEMNIGKPKQMNDITLDTKDNEQKKLVIEYTTTRNDLDALKELKQELLTKGISDEQISSYLATKYKSHQETLQEYDEQMNELSDEEERARFTSNTDTGVHFDILNGDV